MTSIPSPLDLKKAVFPSPKNLQFLQRTQKTITDLFLQKDPRKVLILGPCSLHDETAFLEYALHIKRLTKKLKNFFPILRLFYEKPRTQNSWKGFLSDPFLDNSFQIETALKKTRQLMLKLLDFEIPFASELLDPFSFPYFSDLISWGIIGARTCLSPVHRQMASLPSFPVGFKNSLDGDIDAALNSALFAREKHTFLHLNEHGRIGQINSLGNPLTHIILRGSKDKPNFEITEKLFHKIQIAEIFCPIMIDCAHGNSCKNLEEQKKIFLKALEKPDLICGLMLESFLKSGQVPPAEAQNNYGVSITDPCLSIEETEGLILKADAFLSSSWSISIS